jgi:hypothetical protein
MAAPALPSAGSFDAKCFFVSHPHHLTFELQPSIDHAVERALERVIKREQIALPEFEEIFYRKCATFQAALQPDCGVLQHPQHACLLVFGGFRFEDMLMIDPNGMKEVLAKIDRKILTVALKGTSEQLKTHFLTAMSQRGADMLREDMDSLGPVKIKDVETAQQQIISTVRELEAEGLVSLKGAVGEQYVV